MLRVEKELYFLFKEKERWWTGDLIKGLLYALAFHLFLFFLFRIESFFDPNELPLIPPVAVEVDLSCISSHKKIQEPIFVLPIDKEEVPCLFDLPLECQIENPFKNPLFENLDFSQIEKLEYVSSIQLKEEHDSH